MNHSKNVWNPGLSRPCTPPGEAEIIHKFEKVKGPEFFWHNLTPSGRKRGDGRPFPPTVRRGHDKNEATDIRELIACPGSGLERYSPRLSYLLVDVNAPPQSVERSELLSAISALENSKDPAHTGEVVAALAQWLKKGVRKGVRKASLLV